MTREDTGYRGPVRYVREERRHESGSSVHEQWFDPDARLSAVAWTNPDGSAHRTEYSYDEHGDQIDPDRDRRVIHNPDGSRREIDRIPIQENFFWGRIEGFEGTAGLGFPTRKASQVEVSYDPRGVPLEAVFTHDSGEVTTRVEFRSDAAGNTTEILQCSGAQPLLPLTPEQIEALSQGDREKFGAFLTPGALEVRTCCSYDEAGHLLERTTYLGNELHDQIVWTYNEHGDRATWTEKDGWPARFEYEYDEHGNWTRQVVTHGMGSDETLRKFQYYE
jgi:hypothetical protein